MHLSTRLLGTLLLVLCTVLPLAAAVPALATQRTISNTAQIEWEAHGRRVVQQSNRVDLVVTPGKVALDLSLYRFASGPGTVALPVTSPECRDGGGYQVLAGPWRDEPLSPATVAETREIRPGEPLVFKVVNAAANRSAAEVDAVELLARTRTGDRARLTAYESGRDTGIFTGFVQMVRGTGANPGDCRLTVEAADRVTVEVLADDLQSAIASGSVDVVEEPVGYVFDSYDGHPVSGAKIALVDDATGAPAAVFGDDGQSPYPSIVTSGDTVTDAAGNAYAHAPGAYRFPLVRAGRYRIVVDAPESYSAPSIRSAADLGGLRGPDGAPFRIADASFGRPLLLDTPAPVAVGLPVDPDRQPLQISPEASTASAGPGQVVRFTVTFRNNDGRIPTGTLEVTTLVADELRLRPDSIVVANHPAAIRTAAKRAFAEARAAAAVSDEPEEAELAPDGRSFTVRLPALAAGTATTISYAAEIRTDARAGTALSRILATDASGDRHSSADTFLRIERETIGRMMTVIGRVTDGGCAADPKTTAGIPGVRIMLEDGSYAITDRDGRYHFEGVAPGTHVVQLDDGTLPRDRALADCARNSRSAGRAFSRFVDGRGGALKRVDFHAVATAPRAAKEAKKASRPVAQTDAQAAGAERDWLAGQEPGIAWLFPEPDHNPRAPAVRVAIKHLPAQTVKLFVAGREVDPVAFEGARKNEAGTMAVSVWRGIPLETGATQLRAEVRHGDGSLAETLTRTVRYGASPMRAELLRDRSVLVADGVTRPILAVRLTDRDGRPVRHGLVGDFEVPAPYYPAVEAEAQQARQLAGLERARPFWHVEGEQGIAYIELEPTTASGTVSLRFHFRDRETVTDQRLEAWLDPGDRPWTIVGLAEGTVGYNRLNERVERLADESEDLITDGRLALYAKGRVRGKWLMTLSYDSDKREEETRFGGVIDPDAYYTVYADRSERRYDASSIRKLYLKLERPQFYALFGDYETGIDQPELARYVRAFNGVKAEYRSNRVAATAFAADSPNRHRHDELQGNGLSGPYALGARDILPNSERVSIEVRDRLRSERIAERRLLTRHIDYDIDYAAGTLRFREPILSRSSDLDPQFIVADYEVDGIASRTLNAGGRAAWKTADGKLQVAATAIRDADSQQATSLAGADIRYRPSASTEIRAEVAVSDTETKAEGAASPGTATAWQIEAEHHGSRFDVLAYAREREGGFGVGQLSAAENGTRKVGVDARARFGDAWSVTGSAWHEDYLASNARRTAARALVEYRGRSLSSRAGFTFADDRLADGRQARSTLLQLGATKRLLDNRLELDAQSEIPLGGDNDSIDFPARHRLGARYALTSDINLIGAYEIADGEHVDARTARIGFDLKPWAGARIAVTGNVQDIDEYGPRSFAAFGLSQSLVLDKHWSVDFSLDSNKTLGGIDPARVLNPLHPVTSGGFIGSGGITEDFTAVTAGATYRAGSWSVTGRAEYRAGDQGDRYGFTAAALRQIGEGSAIGGALNWFTATGQGGVETRTANLQASWAHRPAGSNWSWLDKFELREDSVTGAVAGLPGPIGIPLGVSGNARSRRMVNSLSINYSAKPTHADGFGLSEISLFWGTRYVDESYGEEDLGGWSNVVGADVRLDLGESFDIGLAGTVRAGLGARSFSWSAGPNIGFTPAENAWLSLGWNVAGFHDRDFEEARYTRSGPYVTMRIKFDQLSLAGLGLGRRAR
ncbi:MAG TPA: hypothetical protein VF727_08895 [Allosphingosinicella sp.]|jgi:hypothetical protein